MEKAQPFDFAHGPEHVEGRKIRIRWARSGIGFSYRAKEMIRSLGLRRLNQIVERPDTPQVRGLVARVAHLVEVVKADAGPIRLPGPEYTVVAAELAPAPMKSVSQKAAAAASGVKGAPDAPQESHEVPRKTKPAPKTEVRPKETPSGAKKTAKRAAAAKAKSAEKAQEAKKKPKAAGRKEHRATGKSKK